MRFSLTKIETFEQCGFKYKLRYHERLPEPKNMYSGRGTAIHTNIENFLKNTGELEDELGFYRTFFEGLRDCGHPLGIEHEAEIGPGWKPVVDGGEVMIVAKYDLYMEFLPAAHTFDWKTGKEYKEAHKDQRELYSGIIMSATPQVDTVFFKHVYVDHHHTTPQEIKREELPRIQKHWDERMDRVATAHPLTLVPRPQFLCDYCGYRKAVGGPCKFG